MKTRLIPIFILLLILIPGCIDTEHESGISGILISLDGDRFNILPLDIYNIDNVSEINIIVYIGESSQVGNVSYENIKGMFEKNQSTFPISIDDVKYDTIYNFYIQLSFIFFNSSQVNYKINGTYIIEKPDIFKIDMNEINEVNIIIIKESNNRSIIQISNIDLIFDVGVDME